MKWYQPNGSHWYLEPQRQLQMLNTLNLDMAIQIDNVFATSSLLVNGNFLRQGCMAASGRLL
jgi:hypothetical protein